MGADRSGKHICDNLDLPSTVDRTSKSTFNPQPIQVQIDHHRRGGMWRIGHDIHDCDVDPVCCQTPSWNRRSRAHDAGCGELPIDNLVLHMTDRFFDWLFFEQTMAPLLIIARHGLMSRRDDRGATASQIPLRIGVTRTEDTRVDIPVGSSTRKNRLLSDSLPEFPGGNHPKPFCDA
jgi:hypothetical protein